MLNPIVKKSNDVRRITRKHLKWKCLRQCTCTLEAISWTESVPWESGDWTCAWDKLCTVSCGAIASTPLHSHADSLHTPQHRDSVADNTTDTGLLQHHCCSSCCWTQHPPWYQPPGHSQCAVNFNRILRIKGLLAPCTPRRCYYNENSLCEAVCTGRCRGEW